MSLQNREEELRDEFHNKCFDKYILPGVHPTYTPDIKRVADYWIEVLNREIEARDKEVVEIVKTLQKANTENYMYSFEEKFAYNQACDDLLAIFAPTKEGSEDV